MKARCLSILFVNYTRKWGGVKTWTLDYGRALQDRGHRVAVVVRPATAFVDACRRAGFGVHPVRLGAKYSPVGIARVLAVLRAERPDVAVVNISKDLNVGAVAARIARVPVVHRIGLVEDFKGSREERLWHRFLVDRAVVPSRYLRDRLLETVPWFSADRLAVVPNSKRPDGVPLARPGDAEGPVVFGVTSQLSPSKGHLYLLQACEKLRVRGVDFRLRIAGTGGLEARLRTECDRRGLGALVSFDGFQASVPDFLAGLHGFVLPSLNESFSNAVLEAMFAGLPVVAFRAGGVPEVVGDAGVLVAPGDVDGLAAALERFARDPDLRRTWGCRARRRAADAYDLGRNVAMLERLFAEVAGR